MGIFKGFVNKENNSNRIYSREDIGRMSSQEFSKNEKAIDHQMQTVGVPTNKDLQNSSDVVYVSAYKRADGTEVKAYYRSKPDGIGTNNSSNNPPGDLVPNTNYGNYIDESIDKILGLFSGGYTGESIVPTDKNNPIDKLGNTTILAQILNLVSGKETKEIDNENILQKILSGAKTNGTNGDIVSNLLNILSDGNIGDLGKIVDPKGTGGGWDEQIPSDKSSEDPNSNIPELGNPLPAILDYINTGKIDLNKFLAIPKTDGGIIDENPWGGESGKEDKKSKKEEEKEEEEKINPLNDLLNYAFTGEFNKDVFISHVVDSYTNQASKYLGDSDPETKKLLKYIKDSNEQIDKILDSAVNLLPEDSQITNAVKGLVQYKKSMCEQMETMLDPEKRFKQQAEGLKQWLSDFTDFTGQLVSGDFQNIKWAEIGQELHISEMARAINPIAGIVATLAVDVAPKVIKLTEACNAGDKVEIIQNAIAAFTNCMSVIGELQEALSDKLAVVSKDVDAKIYNQATQTYQNLDKLQDAGYKYETYVKAEMFDQANQEAIKLNDLSTEMMQGQPTGFAANLDNIDVDSITNDNFEPSNMVLQGGISKTDYPDINIEALDKQSSQVSFGDSIAMASEIADSINVVMNAVANINLNDSSSPQFKSSVSKLNISIDNLKKIQAAQKNDLDFLLQKLTTTKDQDSYSKLLQKYSQQKQQYRKTQDLNSQLDYALRNKDYQGAAKSAKNYMRQNIQSRSNQNPSREHYSNKVEELINNALGIQPASAEEVPSKTQFATSPDGGPMLKTGLSYNNGTSVPKTVPTKIEAMAGAGESISASRTFNDFIKAMGKDSAHGQQVLKKVLKTYNSQFGKTIKASYNSELRAGVKKILNECMDSMKAMKAAGKIAEKASPYLAFAYIFEQYFEGYQKNGNNGGIEKAKAAGFEILSTFILESVVTICLGIEALPAFAIVLIIEFILNKLKSIEPNYPPMNI